MTVIDSILMIARGWETCGKCADGEIRTKRRIRYAKSKVVGPNCFRSPGMYALIFSREDEEQIGRWY